MTAAILSCVLPAGWQHLEAEALLARAAGEAVADAPEIQRAVVTLAQAIADQPFALTALRFRADSRAVDFLAIAMPDVADGDTVDAPDDDGSGSAVRLGDRFAIAHHSDPSSPGTGWFRASVQLVLEIPPDDRGAVVTLLSSEPGTERLLETEAESIAASLRLSPAALVS